MQPRILLYAFAVYVLLMSGVVSAKDYFGLNLATETIETATNKAKALFADRHRLNDLSLRIDGNGLLRFYGWFDYLEVYFRPEGGVDRIDVFANHLSNDQMAKLVKHLQEDYDLSELSALPYQGKDIRGVEWSARLQGKHGVMITVNNVKR